MSQSEKNKKVAPQDMEALIAQLPLHEQEKLLDQVAEYKAALEREKCQESFMAFVKKMWPGFINGRHHAVMAKAFEDVASGKIKRLAISCPPRHTKSQFGSYLFPAWFLGKFPDKKIMQVSNTAELAVGFGRNVRNLVSSDQYNEIFKNVNLRQDSKSAGRWAVNEYGEYFACIALDSLVRSSRGLVPADSVKPGDMLVGCAKPSKVLSVYANTHDKGYSVNGLLCSAEHPVWTQNRGWVYAKDIEDKDILVVESILDRMKAHIRSFYGNLEHADVSPLVQHEVPMWEPQGRALAFVRWTRNNCVRAMDVVRELFGRYGGGSTGYDAGQDRREWPVQSGQLPMGDGSNSGQQQAQQRPAGWKDDGRSSKGAWDHAGSDSVQDSQRDEPVIKGEAAQEELRSYGDPENIGWLRRSGAWIIAHCGLGFQFGGKGKGAQRYLEGTSENFWQVFGLCVGVRPAGKVVESSSGGVFINYLLEGDHAFFANGVLTHNCGVGGTLTGRGADIVIIDDAHSEQEAKMAAHDPSVYDSTYEWYTSGPRQRLQPGGAIIMIATRWSERDLIGRVIQDSIERGKPDEWRVIEFPAILPSGKPLWPEYWPLELLDDLKAELPPSKWNAQYQQKPTGEEGALVKRDWWNVWEQDDPPRCEFIIQAWDTAFTKNERSDFSACTTWGVFYLNENPNDPHIILLDAFQKRMEFPELKEKARAHYMEWEPDDCIIEAKAAGASLIQELNQQGDIFVRGYTPSRGTRQQSNDKIARMNSVTPIFQGGKVWAPDTRWARELIDQMAAFPNAAHDDLCLVGGTLIEMADGSLQAIETVKVGQTVKTPLGPKQVVATGPTGVKSVLQIRAGGNTLEATAGHRISTTRGWVSIDTIKMSDTVKMSQTKGAFLWLFPQKMVLSLSRLFSMAASTTVTQMQKLTRIRGITRSAVGAGSCTVTSGNFTTDQYQMGTTFITKMETGATTQLKTWSACQHPSTTKSTLSTPLNFKKAPSELLTLKKFKDLLLSGTEAKKAELGTEKTQANTSSPVEQQELLGRNHFKSDERIRSSWFALFAKSRLMRYLSRLNFAQMRARVETVKETNEQKLVYNLSVDGAECYYANGFLVHNCDTAVMAITRFRQGGFLRLESDAQDEPQSFRRKAAFY